jgi:hypothetical protein
MTLGSLGHDLRMLMYPAFMIMYAIFYLIGTNNYFRKLPLLQNGFLVFGFTGTIITLLTMSFKSNWKDMATENYHLNNLILAPEFIICVILCAIAGWLFYQKSISQKLSALTLQETAFSLFLLIFMLGTQSVHLAVILVNLLVFALGILLLRAGTKHSHLGVINTGMLVIALLVVCRSFDTDLTFVVKGILFVLVGIGFFVANWMMIKKKN